MFDSIRGQWISSPSVFFLRYIHRKTFFIVLIADAVLIPLATYLASIDIKSWMIAGPMFAINLPAIPLMILSSVLYDDDRGPDSQMAKVIGVCSITGLYISVILVSSFFWAFVAMRLIRRRSRR